MLATMFELVLTRSLVAVILLLAVVRHSSNGMSTGLLANQTTEIASSSGGSWFDELEINRTTVEIGIYQTQTLPVNHQDDAESLNTQNEEDVSDNWLHQTTERVVVPGASDGLERLVKNHFLKMLHLSSAPAVLTQDPVPTYMHALLQAVKNVPPLVKHGSDQVMWAVKSFKVDSESDTTVAYFQITQTSHRINNASRVELVFEGQFSGLQEGQSHSRILANICHSLNSTVISVCQRSQLVRHRRVHGGGHQYDIFDVSKAFSPRSRICQYGVACMIKLQINMSDINTTNGRIVTLLVVYHNILADSRATRKALKASSSSEQEEQVKEVERERWRRSSDTDYLRQAAKSYCRLHSWSVDFRELNWTWIRAPTNYKAGYCSGACPLGPADLELANVTNHAFLRIVHRSAGINDDGGRLPAPTCVPVLYSPLVIIYQRSNNTIELRTINEMTAESCGCL